MDKSFDNGEIPDVLGKDEKRVSVGSDYSFKYDQSYGEIAVSKQIWPV